MKGYAKQGVHADHDILSTDELREVLRKHFGPYQMFCLDGHGCVLSDLRTKQELSRAIIQNNIAVAPSPKVGLRRVDRLPASDRMMREFEADEPPPLYVFQIPVCLSDRRCELDPRDLQIFTMEELQRVLGFHFPEKLASGAARFHDEGLASIPRLPFNCLTRAQIASVFKAFRIVLIMGPAFKCFKVVDGASTFGPPTTMFPPITICLHVPALDETEVYGCFFVEAWIMLTICTVVVICMGFTFGRLLRVLHRHFKSLFSGYKVEHWQQQVSPVPRRSARLQAPLKKGLCKMTPLKKGEILFDPTGWGEQ